MNQLLKGSDSSLTGWTTIQFDQTKLPAIVHLMNAMGVNYGLGAKISPISSSPPVFLTGQDDPEVDCSGFHRYAFWHATGGFEIPDGSVNQNDWYAQNGFKHDQTSGPNDPIYVTGLNKNYLYACFCRAGTRGETIGHVWYAMYINEGWWTFESCGGQGPTSRPTNTPILASIVTDLYPIAKVR